MGEIVVNRSSDGKYAGNHESWNTFWGTAGETTAYSRGGRLLYTCHQGTVAALDLESGRLLPVAGKRDSFGGEKGLPWARNEWHGPARGSLAISGDSLYWVTGSRVIAIRGGAAGPPAAGASPEGAGEAEGANRSGERPPAPAGGETGPPRAALPSPPPLPGRCRRRGSSSATSASGRRGAGATPGRRRRPRRSGRSSSAACGSSSTGPSLPRSSSRSVWGVTGSSSTPRARPSARWRSPTPTSPPSFSLAPGRGRGGSWRRIPSAARSRATPSTAAGAASSTGSLFGTIIGAGVGLLAASTALALGPRISEFLAENHGGLRDEDGEASDWIEVHHPGAAPLNLQGWSLTDDPRDLRKWRFPSVVLGPGSYLVVFASGKDRAAAGAPLHANFRLDADGEYLVRPIFASPSPSRCPWTSMPSSCASATTTASSPT